MSNTSLTPNMSLVVPTVGQDPGPDWANNINADLGILDQHNHSSGQGVQITPNGLNINADLPINSNNLTLVNTMRFNNLSGSLAGIAPNLGVIYEAVNELYYNDGVGNVVQLTKAGSVNSTSSGISSGTATASFVGGVLVVDANVNTPANVQGASFLFGNNISGSNYLTLEPPSAMASSYTATLPPINSSGSTAFMTYDTSNNMGVGPALTGGITSTNIAAGAITQSLLAPKTTGTTVGAGGIAITPVTNGAFNSPSFVVITATPATITTTGRPVWVSLNVIPGMVGQIFTSDATTDSNTAEILFFNQTTSSFSCTFVVGSQALTYAGGNRSYSPAGAFSFLDTSINGIPGTYAYNLYMLTNSGVNLTFSNINLVVYEI
jgi:hypothetical protein